MSLHFYFLVVVIYFYFNNELLNPFSEIFYEELLNLIVIFACYILIIRLLDEIYNP